jgi:predicted nuclease of predicted toxin-antitoxin system
LKLLFDANLSPKLIGRLTELFPDSTHVFDTGLERLASDERIWSYAAANGFAIVTADADFVALAEMLGPPPQVVRLENCNYSTSVVEELLRRNAIRIADLGDSESSDPDHSKPGLTEGVTPAPRIPPGRGGPPYWERTNIRHLFANSWISIGLKRVAALCPIARPGVRVAGLLGTLNC